MKYGISKILRYNFDCQSLELMTLFGSTSFSSFIYFSTILKSKETATLLVVIMISLLLEQVEISDFTSLNVLLMLKICVLVCVIILSALFILIKIMICFFDRPLVIILTLDLSFQFMLFIMLCISITLLDKSLEKAFLILMISLILPLKACIYNQLLLLEAKFDNQFFLKNLDLAKILLLSLKEIGRGIHKTSTCFFFVSLLIVVLLTGIFLLELQKVDFIYFILIFDFDLFSILEPRVRI